MRLFRSSPRTRTPTFVLLGFILAAATWTTSAAYLLRGQPANRQLETALDFQGVSINVNSNGETVVETPWGVVITGENGTSVHGPGPTTLGNLSCDTLGAWDTDAEPSCTTALPAFFNATATFGQGDKPRDRRKVMDDFCGTPCGDVWTAGVVAESLHCTPGSLCQEQGDSNNIVDVSDDGVVVNVPGVTVNTTRDGGVNVQAPGTSVTRDSTSGRLQVEAAGDTASVDAAASADAATTAKTGPAKSLKSNNDKATTTTRTSTSTSSSTKGEAPTYPAEFPGLRMGCIKDKKNKEYCAVKQASIAAAVSPACEFYLSCCYAQYAKMFNAIPSTFVKEVEKACPGSTAFLEGDLCT